ncbi:hypothetical protein [Nonomuraea sp. KM90]|uniref:hypothetical protein n=1 Tax=Nonomuraea sp. KM90 TaxID=3457428 RepID=UPI003FCEE074
MIDGRADIVEQAPRRPRRAGIVVLLALLAVPLIAFLTGRDTDRRPAPVVTAPAPDRQARGVVPNALYPAASGTGGTRTLRVTFPDGSRAELTYPAGLNLASLGARPYTSATLSGGGTAEVFRPLTAPFYGEAEIAAGRPKVRALTRSVTLWPGPLGVDGAGQVLLFGFGDWRVALQDETAGMTFEQRLAWAENLRGRLTPDGFLTLSAGGPLRLSRPGEVRDGVLVGPQLWLGGLSRRMLVIAPDPGCGRPSGGPSGTPVVDPRHTIAGSACRDGFYLAASGDDAFVRSALKDVRARAL